MILLCRNISTHEEDKVTILKEMEFLLHQYDVAKDFVKVGGLKTLLASLNNTALRGPSALALGAALQGYVFVLWRHFSLACSNIIIIIILFQPNRSLLISEIQASKRQCWISEVYMPFSFLPKRVVAPAVYLRYQLW